MPTSAETAPAGAAPVVVNFVQPVVTSATPVGPSLSPMYAPAALCQATHARSKRPVVAALTLTMPVYVCPAVTLYSPDVVYQPAAVAVMASECVPARAWAVEWARVLRVVSAATLPHVPTVPPSNDASSAERGSGGWPRVMLATS